MVKKLPKYSEVCYCGPRPGPGRHPLLDPTIYRKLGLPKVETNGERDADVGKKAANQFIPRSPVPANLGHRESRCRDTYVES